MTDEYDRECEAGIWVGKIICTVIIPVLCLLLLLRNNILLEKLQKAVEETSYTASNSEDVNASRRN